jgi:CRISPR-associated protein Csb1
MSMAFTLEDLRSSVAGNAAAFRSVTKLQPIGGEGDKIFPATYAGGVYAEEERRIPGSSTTVPCVLLNSVQSEANHAEDALKRALLAGGIELPLIEVDFSEANKQLLKPLPNLTSLEAPHRLADAILRDCVLPDGTRFSKSHYAECWRRANLWNATPIYQLCPTALVFGMWGSPEKPGGLGAKFERAYVSEIVAVDVTRPQLRRGFRIDPLESSKNVAVKLNGGGFEVLADPKSKGALRPSEINHGNILYESQNAGIRCRYAEQTTVISLGAIRKLRFPVDSAARADLDDAGRTVLAAIGLCAAVLSAERGTSLRSRCHLHPVAPRTWQLLDKPGTEGREFELSGEAAMEILRGAVSAAKAAGLGWMEKKLTLTPTPELVELVRKSQEMAAKESGEGEPA